MFFNIRVTLIIVRKLQTTKVKNVHLTFVIKNFFLREKTPKNFCTV